ncbi:MAG: CoA transferase [Deltaproteobacteria bacterium]|nr:CoA transferase [Deltaproteobacteria bacterium]
MKPALAGLRVLDASDEAGRLAGRLLAELGADVVRIRRGVSGAALAGAAGARGGVLDWWYDGGTRRVPLDLADARDRGTFADLAARCDVLLETEPPGRLASLGIGHEALAARNPRLAHVSLTPFGATGPRAHWQASDLVASALGGVLSVSGTPDAPLNGWGRQSFNVGGFYAAITALAALRAARTGRRAVHVDLSLQHCVVSCTEHLLMYWFFPEAFPERLASRQGSLHWTRLYEVVPCATGHAMVTPAPNASRLFKWMAEDGMLGSIAADPPRDAAGLFARSDEVMSTIRAWAATRPAAELFAEGQRRRLPFGEVRSVRDAASSPQIEARGFLRPLNVDGAQVRVPGPAFRMLDTPAAPPAPPPGRGEDAAAALAAWAPRPAPGDGTAGVASARRGSKPLAGVRIVDFTWVLAGPHATRILGDLGADVVKLQTEARSQGTGHNDHPFFAMWNRSKRSATLDMKHARAVATVRGLVERADVVIDNFAPGVLDRWGIGYETQRGWNERIVCLGLSGCGRDGPWRDHVTFAPTIHALCGITALTGPTGRRDVGHGISISDHVSGLAGALAILAALEARERTGRGQRIDLSQLELGAYLIGPALLEIASGGGEAVAQGNRDGLDDIVPNEVYRCAGGRWLAVSARNDADWQRLCDVLGRDVVLPGLRTLGVAARRERRAEIDAALAAWAAARDADDAMHLLQESGVPAGKVQDARDLVAGDPQLAARDAFVTVPHASLGTQSFERFPGTFSGVDLEPYRAAPAFGEHTFEVYGELLGMSEEEIALAIADDLLA